MMTMPLPLESNSLKVTTSASNRKYNRNFEDVLPARLTSFPIDNGDEDVHVPLEMCIHGGPTVHFDLAVFRGHGHGFS